MILFVYVDNSNVWIEGRRASAVAKGLAPSFQDAIENNIVDGTWNYDFGRLYELSCPTNAQIGRSLLLGSRPPANDSLWQRARDAEFEVEVYDRNAANREKQVDTGLATRLLADSYEHMQGRVPDVVAVLIAGDGDYVPPIRDVQRRGIKVRVVFWSHAVSRELKDAADEFVSLDENLDFLNAVTRSRPVHAWCPELAARPALRGTCENGSASLNGAPSDAGAEFRLRRGGSGCIERCG